VPFIKNTNTGAGKPARSGVLVALCRAAPVVLGHYLILPPASLNLTVSSDPPVALPSEYE
jgi:hypothetical protein